MMLISCFTLPLNDLYILAINSGFDAQDMIVKLQEECRESVGPVGVNVDSGEVLQPVDAGIFDNYCVKKQILNSW